MGFLFFFLESLKIEKTTTSSLEESLWRSTVMYLVGGEQKEKDCLNLIFLALFLMQRPSKWAVGNSSQVALTHLTASVDQAPRQNPLTAI